MKGAIVCAAFAVGIFFLEFSPSTTYAQPLSIDFGVDKDTRDLVNGLPEKIRKEIETAVRDLLPEIDTHVERYILDVDLVIHKNIMEGIDALQCSATGVIENAKATTSASLAKYFFLDVADQITAPGIPDTLKQLDDTIHKTRSSIKFSSEARQIQLAYDNLMHFASIVNCMTKIDKFPVLLEVQEQTSRISGPAMEWRLLVGNNPDAPNCKLPAECAQMRRRELQALIGATGHPGIADPRDVAAVKALESFSDLPSDPEAPSWIARLAGFDYVDILAYEEVFYLERQIERSVEGARMSREVRAAELWRNAVAARDSNAPSITEVESQMAAQTSMVDYHRAIPWTEKILNDLGDARSLAKQAVVLDPRFTQLYTEFDQTTILFEKRTDAAHTTAVNTVKAHSNLFQSGPRPFHLH